MNGAPGSPRSPPPRSRRERPDAYAEGRLRKLRRTASRLLAGLALVLMVAVIGIGAASAQSGSSQSSSPYQQFVDRVAQLLGKKPSQVQSAMVKASEQMVDQAVKEGRITQAEASRIKARIEQTGRPFPLFGPGGHHFGRFDLDHGVVGTVSKVNGSTLTVSTPDGSRTVKLGSSTRILDQGSAVAASAIKSGDFVRVIGQTDNNGVVNAQVVLIGQPGGWRFHGGWSESGQASDQQ